MLFYFKKYIIFNLNVYVRYPQPQGREKLDIIVVTSILLVREASIMMNKKMPGLKVKGKNKERCRFKFNFVK